ncbi:hypothetical protein PVAND_017377 [Polypedilum vanderplanki]|uniref:C2H2-type domain-containing protein n=1 Tax=Polypedilum vanderplanki TaxID=319348 RepID=A0A9J6BIE8_POLVA|nr:hypothetical protein PVAND_017377 [Polypedilum vanderplanki]
MDRKSSNTEKNQQNQIVENNKNIFECKICFKVLKSKNGLYTHFKKLHSKHLNLKVLFCDHCELKFIQKGSLISHLKSKHQKGKEIIFECDFDGKIFDSKGKLWSHMTTCHRTIEKCKICGRKIKNLNKHMGQAHSKEDEKVQCHFCDKKFICKEILNTHLKTHNKQFQCKICESKFSYKHKLNEHLKYHDGQFRCKICFKKFTQQGYLKVHLKTHNKNRIKNLKCNRCDYSTDNKHCLASHLKTHNKNREKNLKCNQCDYKTDRKGSLKNHLQIHNPNRVKIPCLYCNYEANSRDPLSIQHAGQIASWSLRILNRKPDVEIDSLEFLAHTVCLDGLDYIAEWGHEYIDAMKEYNLIHTITPFLNSNQSQLQKPASRIHHKINSIEN